MKIKKHHLKVLFILLNIFIFVFLAIFIYQLRKSPSTTATSSPEAKTVSTQPAQNETLPIRTKHKNVANTTVFYTLVGQVAFISDTSIALKSDDDALPTFNITDKSQYYKSGQGLQPQPISKDLIQVGSKIILTVSYDYGKKLWYTNRITLNETSPANSAR